MMFKGVPRARQANLAACCDHTSDPLTLKLCPSTQQDSDFSKKLSFSRKNNIYGAWNTKGRANLQ